MPCFCAINWNILEHDLEHRTAGACLNEFSAVLLCGHTAVDFQAQKETRKHTHEEICTEKFEFGSLRRGHLGVLSNARNNDEVPGPPLSNKAAEPRAGARLRGRLFVGCRNFFALPFSPCPTSGKGIGSKVHKLAMYSKGWLSALDSLKSSRFQFRARLSPPWFSEGPPKEKLNINATGRPGTTSAPRQLPDRGSGNLYNLLFRRHSMSTDRQR